MDWSTLIATITGAVIGVGATMLAERAQWRRSQTHHWSTVRREAYAAYLAALSDGSAALRRIVRERAPDTDVGPALHEALLAAGPWRTFHSLAMIGPPDVVAKAEDAQLALQRCRETLVDNPDLSAAPYVEARNQLLTGISVLRNAMREDLHLPSLGVVANRPRW